jgi:hypothetical protein
MLESKLTQFVTASQPLARLEPFQVYQIIPGRLTKGFAAGSSDLAANKDTSVTPPSLLVRPNPRRKRVQSGLQLTRFRRPISGLGGAELAVSVKFNSLMQFEGFGYRPSAVATAGVFAAIHPILWGQSRLGQWAPRVYNGVENRCKGEHPLAAQHDGHLTVRAGYE